MYTLLIIEDDTSLQKLYKQEFAEEGYCVLMAANGIEALSFLEQGAPDIAILDLVLPGMDGIEVLERFINQAPQLPVVINTAYSVYQTNYLTWSADASVVKSSDLTELKETIRTILLNKHDTSRNPHA